VATVEDVVQVRGIRCERCMARLAKVLDGHAGLESANADFQGNVTLVYDDERTSREALLKELLRGGFREQAA
jgi:Heavy-metal-associated domain